MKLWLMSLMRGGYELNNLVRGLMREVEVGGGGGIIKTFITFWYTVLYTIYTYKNELCGN
jgi:hypothetical protein